MSSRESWGKLLAFTFLNYLNDLLISIFFYVSKDNLLMSKDQFTFLSVGVMTKQISISFYTIQYKFLAALMRPFLLVNLCRSWLTSKTRTYGFREYWKASPRKLPTTIIVYRDGIGASDIDRVKTIEIQALRVSTSLSIRIKSKARAGAWSKGVIDFAPFRRSQFTS